MATGKAAQEKGTSRELQIVKVANAALFNLRFKGGGELPASLKDQHYTSASLAQKAIDDHQDNK